MDSKEKRRAACHSDNNLPNTIVIQLVSPQSQALPGSKAPVEQQRRPAFFAQNSTSPRAAGPPQMPSKNRPEMSAPNRRRTPPFPLRNSAPENIQSNTNNTSQPPGQGRSVCYRMEYVLHPEDCQKAPIYNPPPRPVGNYYSSNGRTEQMEQRCHCCCCRCRQGRRWIPEPEHHSEEQVRPRTYYDTLQERRNSTQPKDLRDQATNTQDEPQDLQSLKLICETLGRAMVAAATAAVEAAAQKSQPPADHSPDKFSNLAQAVAQEQSGASEYVRDEASKKKTSFSDSIQTSSPCDEERETPEMKPNGRVPVVYPKTPRPTLGSFISQDSQERDSLRIESGSSPGVFTRSSKVNAHCQRPRNKASARRTPIKKFPMVRPGSAGRAKDFSGPAIRRRLPKENVPPVKNVENPGPTSPGAETLMVEQSEDPGPSIVASPTDLTIDTLPPDHFSSSQNEDCLLFN